MKKKKKFLGKNVFGLLPNYIVKNKIFYCNTVFVLQRRKLGGLKLYCKEGLRIVENCITIHWSVLQ